jgi:iron-sulfur cluster assembly protein
MSESLAEPRVVLTPEAVEYAKRKREQLGSPGAALRLGVRGGGCAGLTYVADFTSEPPRARDVVYDFAGLTVYIDTRSLAYVDGSVIRYERTLMHQGFKWENPQQESSCGCGHTFSARSQRRDGDARAR